MFFGGLERQQQLLLLLVVVCVVLLSSSRRKLADLAVPSHLSPNIRIIEKSQQQPSVTSSVALGTTTSSRKLGDITPQAPLFVLSLPNSGSLALYRYFKCAGLEPNNDFGRYFSNQKPGRPPRTLKEIGRCMHTNMERHQSPLYYCAPLKKPFRVWLDMEVTRFNRCFYPSLAPGGLEALYANYTHATILQITRDPEDWYETLSFDIREQWGKMCNNNHPGVLFPGFNSTRDDWIQFYQDHVNRLRDFAAKHSSLNYIEVQLESKNTAGILQERLGISSDCWNEATKPQQKEVASSSTASTSLLARRPNDITYPVLLVSLSKSGTSTTHDYFSCGTGAGTSIHQWTKNHTTKKNVLIGKCMEYNIQNNRPLLQGCSYYRVWTDIQYITHNGGGNGWSKAKCFFPQFLQNGGLQSFYRSYPHATIMNTIRNASNWFRSLQRWEGLQERWAGGAECHGFPPPNSTEHDWVDFYHQQNEQVRQFAKEHPSLTYVEVALESQETPAILEDIFGFPGWCWGHSNVNPGYKKVSR